MRSTPNFASGAQDSQGSVSDVWPQGHELSKGDVDAFLGMARGWRKWPHRVGSMDLAIRRVAGSFSRPGGRFGQEDRILDLAIALEVLYGGKTGHKLSQRAAGLLGATAKGAEADIRPGKGVLWCAIEDRALEEPASLTRRSRQGVGGRAQSSRLHARELAQSRRATGVGSRDEKPAT